MSSSIQAPSRSLLRILRASQSTPPCSCSRSKCLIQQQQRRCFSSTPSHHQDQPAGFSPMNTPEDINTEPQAPLTIRRWAQTPPAMKAPVPVRPRKQKEYPVNNDPIKLDKMYASFLGKSGPKMLSDETKWLAVTHKSFDHGRRGFNDRLSFLGRQIVELQTSLGLLTAADTNNYVSAREDAYGRQAFRHPATETVGVLNGGGKQFFMHHKQMSKVAKGYGLHEVVRWQPRDVEDLHQSGCDMVYAQSLFAIIGALALEQGGAIANQVVNERILQSVGLKAGMVDAPQTDAERVSA